MEPIIITAFWDVGRGKDCKIPRTNERYYNEFAAWAKIRNRMIIYTDAKSQQTIMKVREEYGLLDRTTIFVIEDIFSIENEIYRKMKQIEENSFFKESPGIISFPVIHKCSTRQHKKHGYSKIKQGFNKHT